MDDKVHTRRPKAPVYEDDEIVPQDQKKVDLALDAWIARNKVALNKSLAEGRKAQRRGKTVVVSSRERFVAEILAKGRKRRAKAAKKKKDL